MYSNKISLITAQFLGGGKVYSSSPLGNGLINQSLLITGLNDQKKYVLQRINENVFNNPLVITSNISVVEDCFTSQHIDYPFLKFLRTASGELFYHDESGSYWRMYEYVEDCCTIDTIQDEKKARQTAFQFARFTESLQGIDISAINPSIPDFHNLAIRFQQFGESIRNAEAVRLESASDCISFLRQRNHYVDLFHAIQQDSACPLRIVHADAKISNILFRKSDLSPYCVIDFDTLMPGYFFSDLGDMVRTMVCSHDENEPDTRKLMFRKNYYDAITEGYCSAMQLTGMEKSLLHHAGALMTYMQALRFVTDFLNGDLYYAISYKEHNLVRAKNQCRLLELMEQHLSLQSD